MSILEGGAFKCYNHLNEDPEPFTTESFEEWNKHCTTTPHFDEITDNCVSCGQPAKQLVAFLQFLPNGQKEIAPKIRCDNCSEELETARKEYKDKGKTKK